MPHKKNEKAPVFTFFTDPEDLWRAMHEDCCRAKKRILFTQYMIYDDHIGCHFLDIFEKKAREGLKVDLTFDPVGSYMVRDTSYIDSIREAGGKIRFYNDVKWYNIFTPAKWFPRNHSKVMHIDDHLLYVGGMCIADHMHDWQDLHARIEGDIDNSPAFHLMRSNRHPTRRARRQVYQEIIQNIDTAKEYIHMVTPYFVPPLGLWRSFKKAARRGVKMKLIISDKTDNLLADKVAKSYMHKFKELGIDVRFYEPTVLHAKYMIIDGEWATFGSTNLDYLSLCRNKEVNIFVETQETIKQLEDIFKSMLKKCRKGSIKDWSDMPFWDKGIAYVGRMLRRFL